MFCAQDLLETLESEFSTFSAPNDLVSALQGGSGAIVSSIQRTLNTIEEITPPDLLKNPDNGEAPRRTTRTRKQPAKNRETNAGRPSMSPSRLGPNDKIETQWTGTLEPDANGVGLVSDPRMLYHSGPTRSEGAFELPGRLTAIQVNGVARKAGIRRFLRQGRSWYIARHGHGYFETKGVHSCLSRQFRNYKPIGTPCASCSGP